jgi:hypothetical protein
MERNPSGPVGLVHDAPALEAWQPQRQLWVQRGFATLMADPMPRRDQD